MEQILHFLKKQIKQKLTNSTIFKIFKYNKSILLFLIEEKIMTIDECIAGEMMQEKLINMFYPQYFFKEVSSISRHKYEQYYYDYDYEEFLEQYKNQLPEKFEEKRKIGQNDGYICQLIQNDLIDEFIKYVNQNNYSLESKIKPSIYETNFLLLKKQPSLIEYSAFFGSIQIFKYLLLNNVELTSSLWFYAVHSNNPELIHIIEEKQIEIENDFYEQILIESIKSHHNDLSDYFLNNYIQNINDQKILKYFNFSFINADFFNDINFGYLCKYNYIPFVKELLESNKIDINRMTKFKFKPFGYFNDKYEMHIAIEKDNFDIVKLLLLNEKTDVNALSKIHVRSFYASDGVNKLDDWFGCSLDDDYVSLKITPLFFLILKKKDDVINLLLSNKNIDINLKSQFSRERFESNEYIKFKAFKNPLHYSIEKNKIDFVKLLLKNEKIDVNSLKKYMIISKGTDEPFISKKSYETTPLHTAILEENFEIVKLLLNNKKIDVNAFQIFENCLIGYDPMKWYDNTNDFYIGSKKDIEFLEYNIKKMTDLQFCSIKHRIAFFKLLLAHEKIDVNLQYEMKNKKYQLETNSHDRIDKETAEKKTTLQLAIENNEIEIIKLLLENKKIEINFTSFCSNSNCVFDDDNKELMDENKKEDEFTVLHFAVKKGNIEITEDLSIKKLFDDY